MRTVFLNHYPIPQALDSLYYDPAGDPVVQPRQAATSALLNEDLAAVHGKKLVSGEEDAQGSEISERACGL